MDRLFGIVFGKALDLQDLSAQLIGRIWQWYLPFRDDGLHAFAAEKPTSHGEALRTSCETLRVAVEVWPLLCHSRGFGSFAKLTNFCGLRLVVNIPIGLRQIPGGASIT